MSLSNADRQKVWSQGYACAIATIVRSHGEDTGLREALGAGGLTSVKVLRDLDIDAYDIEILKPLVLQISRKAKP